MPTIRREFLRHAVSLAAAATLPLRFARGAIDSDTLIVDTHQHLWDLERFELPWLADAPDVLRATYHIPEYTKATAGLNVRSVYMEVDVAPEQHVAEASHVLSLAHDGKTPTIAAVIGGRPDDPDFSRYVDRFLANDAFKGVRQVLHSPSMPSGHCLRKEFVEGVRYLGRNGKSFDLCMRPTELSDGLKLSELCPETLFILDHCGNADPKAWRPVSGEEPWHSVDSWKRDIEALAGRPNVICKISGIVARAPQDWSDDDLAPIVNHCLDSFGPDRVVFGGDWPVCLLGAPLRRWVDALAAIISQRPADEQQKLWSQNAMAFYGLEIA